jgi:hypothetical protein
MGLLARLFGRGSRGPSIEDLQRRLDSFMRPSGALVDSRDLTIPARRRRYALFVYGAAAALAARKDLGETETLALLVRFLGTSAGMHPLEVSRLVGECQHAAEDPASLAVVQAGSAAFTRWAEGDAGGAVQRLAQVLKG